MKLPWRNTLDALYSPLRLSADLSICFAAPNHTPVKKLSLSSKPSKLFLLETNDTNGKQKDLSTYLKLKDISDGYFIATLMLCNLPSDDIMLLACNDRIEVLGRGQRSTRKSLPDVISAATASAVDGGGEPLATGGAKVRRSDYTVKYGHIRLPVFVSVGTLEFIPISSSVLDIRAQIKGQSCLANNTPRHLGINIAKMPDCKRLSRRNTMDAYVMAEYNCNTTSRKSI